MDAGADSVSATATKRGSASTTRLRKCECPECGYTIRVTRRWLAVGLPGCPCGETMRCPDAEDYMRYPSEEQRVQLEERDVRRLERMTDGRHGRLMQCGGCNRIIRSAREHCHCGFENDIRGMHNEGGWGSGYSRDGEALPF